MDTGQNGVNLEAEDEEYLGGDNLEDEDEGHNLADPGSQQFDNLSPLGDTLGDEDGLAPLVDAQGDGGRSASGLDIDDLCGLAGTEDIKLALQFITQIQNASLDDVRMQLDTDVLNHLCHPPQEEMELDDPNLQLALDLFLAVSNSSQETYHSVHKAILHCYPQEDMLTYDQIKHHATQLSGITPLIHNMCVNSCITYTGPFLKLQTCLYCGEPHYDPIKLAASNSKVKATC